MENEQTAQKKNNLLTKRSNNYMSLKHMKSLIVLVVGLLAVGCTSLRDSVVGEYEYKQEGRGILKHIYLENGVTEWYKNGKLTSEHKWSIVGGEIHVGASSEGIGVLRINADKSLAYFASIRDGKRKDFSSPREYTYKKIK